MDSGVYGEEGAMKHISFTYWVDGDYYIGYLNDFPDYWTQGTSLEDLTESLKALFEDVETEGIPYIRHVSELVIV
jgi:predicted RNase H-like HicB family nuclease